MPSVSRPSGVVLEVSDHVRVVGIGAGPEAPGGDDEPAATRGPGERLYEPIDLEPPGGGAAPAEDPVVTALLQQDMQLVDAVEFRTADRTEGLRSAIAGEAIAPPNISVEVGPTESAAVLFEKNGVYSWGIRRSRTNAPAERRGAALLEATSRLEFSVPATLAGVGETTDDRRLPGLGFIVDGVRAYILKFAAHVGLGVGVAALERHVHKGIIVMTGEDPRFWYRVDSFAGHSLPTDRAPRILLFLHGTFSSTVGSFGALGASDWGRKLLGDAQRKYDLVIGYDHPTLSEDPFVNASDLLARLEQSGLPCAARFDAVAFSRGALVLRSLTEYLLPSHANVGRVERALFVGCTNAGTQLANPEHWDDLIDLYTNLVVAGCAIVKMFGIASLATKILEEAIKTLGGLVKALADRAVNANDVPGLAAMNPDGDFVRKINEEQPGQPSPAEVFYSAVTSDFDVSLACKDGNQSMSAHLVQWLLDRGADQLMREANDLVVNTASMTAIDSSVGGYLESSYPFGKNPHVYHTVYFTRPETVAAMRETLELPESPIVAETRGIAAPSAPPPALTEPLVDTNIIVSGSSEPVESLVAKIERDQPNWVVTERDDMDLSYRHKYRYAFMAQEIIQAALAARPGWSLQRALELRPELELHEDRRSAQRGGGIVIPGEGNALSGKRTIKIDNGIPVGVYVTGSTLRGVPDLVRIANLNPPMFAAAAHAPELDESNAASVGMVMDYTVAMPVMAPASVDAGSGGDGLDVVELLRAVGGAGEEPSMAAPTMAAAPEPPPVVDCHISASMPAEVLPAQTADLFVTLSLDDIVPRAGLMLGETTGSITLGDEIDVMIQCKQGFASGDPDSTFVKLTSTKRKAQLVFPVTALGEGPGEIWVVATQHARTVGTITLRPRVVATLSSTPTRVSDRKTTSRPYAGDPDVPVLQIFENVCIMADGKPGWELLYVLEMPQGRYLKFRTQHIAGDRNAYVLQTYKEIETAWLGARAGSPQDVNAAQAGFENALRGYGAKLVDRLVPSEVQTLLWQQRDALRAIHVFSEEPFIPWELVYLKQPPDPTGVLRAATTPGMFFAELGLVRWLHNYDAPPTQMDIRDGSAFYVIPDYAPANWKLPEAAQERTFLANELRAQPVTATAADTARVLDQADAVDLFHFSGHGSVPDNECVDAVMTMGGYARADGKYVAEYLAAESVKAGPPFSGPQGRRPWVTLNACQLGRMTTQLQSVSGFAPAFLQRGAGVLVAALWAVRDKPARVFSEALYREFYINGKSLSEAATAARRAARSSNAPDTWLSYAVYGNPSARGTRGWAAEK